MFSSDLSTHISVLIFSVILLCRANLKANRDINFVIMDYLINEGYPAAASNFAKEANIQPLEEEESIRPRVDIRKAIHAGDIETAIHRINDLNPQVRNTLLFLTLCFHDYTLHAPLIVLPGRIVMKNNSPLQFSI